MEDQKKQKKEVRMAEQDFISSPNILKPNVVPVQSVLEQDGDYQSELLQEYCPRLNQRIVYYQFFNDGLAPTKRIRTKQDIIITKTLHY